MQSPTADGESPVAAAGVAKTKSFLQAFITASVGLVVISVVAAILTESVRAAVGNIGPLVEMFMQLLGMAIGTSMTVLTFFSFTGHNSAYLDVELPDREDMKLAAAGLVAVLLAYVLVIALFQLIGVETHEHSSRSMLVNGGLPLFAMMLIASWVVIGPCEELLYRNLVQKWLYNEFSTASAVAISSALFASAHIFAYGGFSSGPAILLVGILSVLLGGAYALTENLTVPIFIHGTYNAIQFMLLYVEMQGGL